ncbi:MAG: hypothetical protein COA96_14420 [SAR86 cluster bacterium]|uniref:Uncharacterized protein n=1 Tax=SAR86 cluster bacterium TaxID=2030880 RepID=A0A2A5AT97_9GAMM|nr:MAG: hypothetical protein COA96_14420 [SAR86 cluster bacterium]
MQLISNITKSATKTSLMFLCSLTVLISNLALAQLPELATPSTASGNATTSKFFAGATTDNGTTFTNSFTASQAVDILTEIQVEPSHVNTVGNLYVAAALGEQYFMRAESGNFIPWDTSLETLQATSTNKILDASELITVIDLAFASAGVASANVNIFLAYNTEANPNEIYYSGTPLNFSIITEDSATSFDLFTSNISQPIIQTRCVLCHTSTGVASDSALVYANSSQAGYLTTNYNTLLNYIENAPNGANFILSKPQGLTVHGGGVQLTPSSEELSQWTEFVSAVQTEIINNGQGSNSQGIFAAVSTLTSKATLRKAAILFAGRIPTDAELNNVTNATDAELRDSIRALMTGDGFHDFLTESANDRLLTRAFSGSIFSIVDRNYYPNSMQFYNSPGTRAERLLTSSALADEPLELIAHVVTNERPYTEVITADYIMVNPYSAAIYGGNVVFDDPTDTTEWREGEITEYYRCTICNPNSPLSSWTIPTDYPHAGILNSPAFLARFPSTATNRNRARSRWAYYFFLGVDIEGLSERTTDQSALSDENNPTLNNENCTVCHTTMDPVAGSFQNYNNDGLYKARPGGNHSLPGSYTNNPSSGYLNGDTWYSDMLGPGFGLLLAPNSNNSIQWLAQEFIQDPRFGLGTVNFWYPAIIGRDPYDLPENQEDSDYQSKLVAYNAEQNLMQTTANNFIAGSAGNGTYNLKDMLVDLVMSDHFRSNSVAEITDAQAVELKEVGTGKLLTPEQLNRKLIDVTGFEWAYGRTNALAAVYGLVYGGIDSFGITDRATELTTLMSTVVTAMANETSCPIVSNDFSKPAGSRKLFVDVELTSLPTTSSSAIRSTIQHLHSQLLGEDLASNDPEINATYDLFEAVWTARIAAGKGQTVSSVSELCIFENVDNPVELDPNQTLRSWAVVLNYLMRDYKFIHE